MDIIKNCNFALMIEMSLFAIQVQMTPGAALTAVGNQTYHHHPHHFHVSHF